jgi:hypothetical protein
MLFYGDICYFCGDMWLSRSGREYEPIDSESSKVIKLW